MEVITEADRQRIVGLKSEARTSNGETRSIHVNAWRVEIQLADKRWVLSMQLIDGSRSTVEDWTDLGSIAAFVGAENLPMISIKDAASDAVHRFEWSETPTGRNDPCWCGSGRKYKRCCQSKPVDYGPCELCGKPGVGASSCKLCDKKYVACSVHQKELYVVMPGHVLRVHPEAVPEVVEKLMRSPAELAALQTQRERSPELWARLFEYIAEQKN